MVCGFPLIKWLYIRVAVGKLMELHGEGSSGGKTTTTAVGEDGEKVDRPDNYEPPVLAEV